MTTTVSGFKDFAEKPDAFSGKDVEKFIRSVKIFIKANESAFTSDMKKILFVLSCMKEGAANEWAQNFTDTAFANDSWGTFSQLMEALQTAFGDPNEAKDSQFRLESFKQGSLTAQEFFAKFEILRRKAKYETKKENASGGHDEYLISLLERNLDSSLIRRVYSGDSVPSSYEDFKDKVIRVYAVEQRFKAINARNPVKSAPPIPPRSAFRPPISVPNVIPSVPAPSAPLTGDRKDGTGITFGGTGQPMQIDRDEARKRGLCFRCGQSGHRSYNCPTFQTQRQQIRAFLTHLDEEELEDAFADADAAAASTSQDFADPQL